MVDGRRKPSGTRTRRKREVRRVSEVKIQP
jgi:hypothetical protein